MNVSEFVTELEALGVRLWEDGDRLGFRAPKAVLTDARREVLRERKHEVLAYLRGLDEQQILVSDSEARYEPFPLTDVQASYLLGRSTAYRFGGVGCQAYLEVEFPELEPARLQQVWRVLIKRHEALRTVIHPDGYQQVLATVPDYRIQVADLRGAGDEAVATALNDTRTELAYREHQPDRWPLFTLRITQTDLRTVLHLSIEMLISDYASVQLLLGELEQLALAPEKSLPPVEISFRDYVLAMRSRREGGGFTRDREYWWRRLAEDSTGLDALPPAPALPTREANPAREKPRFRRLQARLTEPEWSGLRHAAAARGITASTALLTGYAEVINRWSGQQRFTLNLPVFQRFPVHPQVGWLVGDFTSVTLLAVDWSAGGSFTARAQGVQRQLWQDLDHGLCSGVEVLRELARRRGQDAAVLPVVFTSTVGVSDAGTSDLPRLRTGEIVFGCSQTPHVWIDCQVMEHRGALLIGWDVRQDVFPAGLVEAAFEAFHLLLQRLAAQDAVWQAHDAVDLPAPQRHRRHKSNETAAALPQSLLHDGVVAQAAMTPGRPAVIAGSMTLSYQELLHRAQDVAGALAAEGGVGGQPVAVLMDKGWEQVVAVLGTLLAGAAYLPIDTHQPPARMAAMLTDAQVGTILTQPWITGDWAGRRVIGVDGTGVRPDVSGSGDRPAAPAPGLVVAPDIAYVIYTSGSTGQPKGVMISHRAAVNTVQDITARFAVGADDRVLGLANLGFDLSVYDIFGPLSRGGCLVLPEADRRSDPAHWAELIAQHGVTVWNSVPAQLQMLEYYLRAVPVRLPSLRLALLSGDWIPVALPRQIRDRLGSIELVSLGGATEAAIWSIFHPIGAVPPGARRIPYGTPLTNHTFHVLDTRLRDCPDWTIGELYIGGAGLAAGYLGDEARTAERFPVHPRSGQRLYRTGDRGRYLPDGSLEFLGRVDNQVKIRGYRIELGEIEAALESHPAVAGAVAVVQGDDPLQRHLTAFVSTAFASTAFASTASVGDASVGVPPVSGGPVRSIQPPDSAGVARQARDAGRAATADLDRDLLVSFLERADELALATMSDTLRGAGLFAPASGGHTPAEVAAGLGADPRYHRLIRRWLRALTGAGWLSHEPAGGRYFGLRSVPAGTVDRGWLELERWERRLEYGANLLRLVRTSGARLAELLRSEQDPLDLLFPRGALDMAEGAYRDNLVSRCMNHVAIAGIRQIATDHPGDAPLRVLEAGAGVGGTSTGLVPALAEFDVDYLFTDISQFFLNEARQRFGGYPWVRYGRFDINVDIWRQGLRPNSVDLVICANVLHNSTDAGIVLRRLTELLAPGGWLVFVEATLERHPLLISMELLDGLSGGFADVRQETDRTFLSREQWLGLLEASGAKVPLCFPAPDDPLSLAGQHVFFARAKTDRVRTTSKELRQHAASLLPEFMVPAQVQLLDSFPLSANGKVDRAQLLTWLQPDAIQGPAPEAGPEPADELECRIAALWAELLGCDRVGREDSFFALGGDSLLVARLVGLLREREPAAASLEWENLLRQMLQRPTVAALAGYLRNASAEHPAAAREGRSSPVVPLAAGRSDPTWVLVHDGSGTLLPYQALLDEYRLRPGPGGHQSVLGLEVRSSARYLDSDPAQLIARLGQDYARSLLEAHGSRFHLVGYCMGGLIATEVARTLADAGAQIDNLTVISCHHPTFLVDDELLIEYTFALSLGVDPAELGFPPDEVEFGRVITELLTTTPGRLQAGCFGTVDPASSEIGRQLSALAARSHQDRLAAIGQAAAVTGAGLDTAELDRLYGVFRHSLTAVTRYEPEPYAGDITFLRHSSRHGFLPGLPEAMNSYWQRICLGRLRVVDIPGGHFDCLAGPHAAGVCEVLRDVTR